MNIRRVFNASEIKEVGGIFKFNVIEDSESKSIKIDFTVPSMDDAVNLRDRAVLFFNSNEYNFVDSDQFVKLVSKNYLNKDGKVKKACMQIVNGEPVYFTHKNNLYNEK